MVNIFKFWGAMKCGQKVHPADRIAFKLMDPERHGFQLQCLPTCFFGPLRSAPVILLFLSPGYGGAEDADAESKVGRDYYYRTWKGREPLRDTQKISSWFKSRTRTFCKDYEKARHQIAILNIGAYHSKKMYSYASMMALPSSRVVLDWAQSTLFPDAIAKKRIVVCLRAHAHWGLETNKKYPGTLFAPAVNMAGHLLNNQENDRLIKIVRERLC